MKKAIVAGVTLGALAIVGFFAFHSTSAQTPAAAANDISVRSADRLQAKIDAIKKAEPDADKPHTPQTIDLHEYELESYVLYSLKDDIPAKVDSIHIRLAAGTVSADTQLTFPSNSTGNPMVDAFLGGTHELYVKGVLTGSDREGKFDLQDVRVDGIPVPKVLIQTIFEKYVKPKYPDADIKAPFDLPWGIQSVNIQDGVAKVTY